MERRAFLKTVLFSIPGLCSTSPLSMLMGKAAVKPSVGIPILVFHRIAGPKKPYSLSPGQFEKILTAARDAGFWPVSLDEIVLGDFKSVPAGKKPFSITLDDGHPSQLRLKDEKPDPQCAFSIMARVFDEPKATFFVNASTAGKSPFGADGERKIRLTREAGMFLGNHTAGHMKLGTLSTGKIIKEMGETLLYLDGVLKGELAQDAVYLAYPFGILPEGKKSRDAVKKFEYKGRTFQHPAAFSCRLGLGEPMTKKSDVLLCPLPGTEEFETLRYELPRMIISGLKDFMKDVAGRKEVYVHGQGKISGKI